MKNFKKKLLLAVLFLVITFVFLFFVSIKLISGKNSNKTTVYFPERKLSFSAELAKTAKERRIGLMNREELLENNGMLFYFPFADKQSFWMKNTLIPLDILFIDDNKIVDIKKNFLPCKNDSCEIYTSTKPAKYVLEINSGLSDKFNIKEGDKVIIK